MAEPPGVVELAIKEVNPVLSAVVDVGSSKIPEEELSIVDIESVVTMLHALLVDGKGLLDVEAALLELAGPEPQAQSCRGSNLAELLGVGEPSVE